MLDDVPVRVGILVEISRRIGGRVLEMPCHTTDRPCRLKTTRLAVVQPVEHYGKFLIVHPVLREWHVLGLGERVLPQMPFPRFLVHREHVLMPAERVQDRPVGAVLDRVIRPIIAAPAFDAQEPAAIVEVFGVELAAGLGVGVEQLPLEEGPGGGRHGSRNRQGLRAFLPLGECCD